LPYSITFSLCFDHAKCYRAAFAFDKQFVVARLTGLLWKEQRTLEALRTITAGMIELPGWMHRQADVAARRAIRQTPKGPLAVLVEWDGRDLSTMHHRLVGVAGIEGGISRDVREKEAQRRYRTDGEGHEGGDIAFVEASRFSQVSDD
jgi:hypothetical protein